MRTVLLTIPFPEKVLVKLRETAGDKFEIVAVDGKVRNEAYLDAVRKAEVILGDPPPADLQGCDRLRLLQITWAGADAYIRSGCFPENAVLCCQKGAYGAMLAEYMTAAVFSLCRNFPAYMENQRQRVWRWEAFDKPLENANVLILGTGDAGTELAKRLRPAVSRITGIRRRPGVCPEAFDEIACTDRLEELLPTADVVACLLPGTQETKGLLNARRIRLLKKDAVLANAGRGSLIDLYALAELLKSGYLRGAAIDVAPEEPLPTEHPLWDCPNLILTPHIAGSNYALDSPTQERIYAQMAENFRAYVHGEKLRGIVDFRAGYSTDM